MTTLTVRSAHSLEATLAVQTLASAALVFTLTTHAGDAGAVAADGTLATRTSEVPPPAVHSPSVLAQLTTGLDELRRCRDDWDGDGAAAPNAAAIANAERVLAALARLETSAECDVSPDALGGLAFGFYVAGAHGERDRLRAYVECLNKGTVHVVFDDRTIADGVRARALDPARLEELALELRTFLRR